MIEFAARKAAPEEAAPMSPSSEDLTSVPAAVQPEPAAAESEPPVPAASGALDAAVPEAAPAGAPRRRRRRRRRKPAPVGVSPEAVVQNNAAEPAAAGSMPEMTAENAGGSNAETPAIDVSAQAAPQPAADMASALPPRRRRRRRRRPLQTAGQPPSPAEAGDVTMVADTQAAPAEPAAEEEAVEAAPGAPQPAARARRPRMRRPRNAAATPAPAPETPGPETREGPPRRPRRRTRRGNVGAEADQRARRDGTAPETGRREGGERPRGNRRRSAPERPRPERNGRSRAEPERRLYVLEAVVDRGFEDVEEENETHRVHWTIVKRTVADQKSGRQMSAIYVLQRDGVDQEFPNLGAARLAAHKTIVHPEKLTLSKAEHAAARGGGGGGGKK